MATDDHVKALVKALGTIESTLKRTEEFVDERGPFTNAQRAALYDAAEEVQNRAMILTDALEE